MFGIIPIILQAAGLLAGFAWIVLITIETARREKMMTKYYRRYLAMYDDRHSYGSFTFESVHRAGCKANKEDAWSAAVRILGYDRARRIKITKIERYGVL